MRNFTIPTNKLFLIAILLISQFVAKSQDPYSELRAAASSSKPQIVNLKKFTITEEDRRVRTNKLPAIDFKPFEMVDRNGRKLNPDSILKLTNGKEVTVNEYFQTLNNIEKNYLNPRGYTFRDPSKSFSMEIVTPIESLDGRKVPKPIGSYRELKSRYPFLNNQRNIGSQIVKPMDLSSISERNLNQSLKFDVDRSGALVVLEKLKEACNLESTSSSSGPIRTIADTTRNTWTFGDVNTLAASLTAELSRNALIYKFNPVKPYANQSEEKIAARGLVDGSLYGSSFSIINARAELLAPSNTAKPLKASFDLQLFGISVFYASDTASQQYIFVKKWWGKNIDVSTTFIYPLVGICNLTGKVGVKGNIGISVEGGLYRTLVSLTAEPAAMLTGYAEAAADIALARAGVGGNLVFIKANVPMSAWFGIYNQNGCETTLGGGFYAGYNLNFLSGNIYLFLDLFNPFVEGNYSRVVNFDVFKWNGFSQSGTIAEGSFNIAVLY